MGGLWKRILPELRDKASELAWKGYSINYCGKGYLGEATSSIKLDIS